MSADVELSVEVKVLSNRRAQIVGKSNLPAGTQLMLSVREDSSNGFHGQSRTTIQGGGFQSESFGPATGLPDGQYEAGVTMPIPRVQPKNVQTVIGSSGEYLAGSLVNESTLGKSVSVKKEFSIGNNPTQAQHEREKKRVEQYQAWFDKVTDLHRRVKKAPSNSGNLEQWGRFARQFNVEHQAMRDELKDFPLSIRFTLIDPLESVRKMFHATAFNKADDFQEAAESYEKNIETLRTYIEESKD